MGPKPAARTVDKPEGGGWPPVTGPAPATEEIRMDASRRAEPGASSTAPLRVAHVALQLETGGLERLLVEWSRHADRGRFEPLVVCMGRRGPLADEIESAGCRVVALDLPGGIRPRSMLRLASLFRAEAIDVVHTHNTKPLLYAGPAARLSGVGAVVHTRHGQRHGASRRQNLLFRLASRCADRIVCVSEDGMRRSEAEGLDLTRLLVIPNGIDVARFAADGPRRRDGAAIYVGRLTPEKSVDTLLQALALLRGGHPSLRVDVVGGGPCAEELERSALRLGVAERVRFLGPRTDIPDLLRGASLFVLPSLTEGVPLTVLEAMACGLPVVATRVGGTAEAVVDGATGRLVASGDADAFAQAMAAVLDDPERGDAMGAAGLARVRERFDVRAMVAAYERLYERCLADAGRGTRRAAA